MPRAANLCLAITMLLLTGCFLLDDRDFERGKTFSRLLALLPAVDSESELVASFARPSSTYLLETDSNCPHYFCTYDRKQLKNMEFQLSDPAFLDTLGPGTRMLSYSFGGHGLGAPVGDVVVAIDEHGKIIGWMNSNCSPIKYCNGVLEHWKGY